MTVASSGIYRLGRQPEAQRSSINHQYFNITCYRDIMTELSPNSTTMQARHKHERNASMNSPTDMPTSANISGSLVSQTANKQPTKIKLSHSRGISVDSSQDGDDDGSLRKNHSYKRAEEPPRNEDGKMVCKYQGRRGTSFDRKCDWR